jgi:CRISPR-associated protein Cmr6
VPNWREAWHPDKVQVWGRIAKNGQSRAVHWFHDTNRLKDSSLAGKMGQIGRIWHRMYPRYGIQDGKLTHRENEYVELLTIFPDESDNKSQQFMNFLATEDSGFKPLWKCKEKL